MIRFVQAGDANFFPSELLRNVLDRFALGSTVSSGDDRLWQTGKTINHTGWGIDGPDGLARQWNGTNA